MIPSKATSRRVPKENAASPQEIEAAVVALTSKELSRLKQYARWRIRGLGRKASGRNYEDLLQEAITATLADDRRWNKESASFFNYLIGAIRSISHSWGKQFDPAEASLESELIRSTPEGKEKNPLLNATLPAQDGRWIAEANDSLVHVERLVAKRPLTARILNCMREKMGGPEIQKELNISQKEYETEMRWLRRKVRADEGKEISHGR